MRVSERLAAIEDRLSFVRQQLHDIADKLNVLWGERFLRKHREAKEREDGEPGPAEFRG